MVTTVFSQQDAAAAPVALVGAKAAALGHLAGHAIPVPEFFVVSAAELARHLERSGIGWPLASDEQPDGERWAIWRESVAAAPMEEALECRIVESYDRLSRISGHGRVAIRSSAREEDSGSTSFAGQFDSFLNVDRAALFETVKDCWASYLSERSRLYRAERHLPLPPAPTFAVIIQIQVFSCKAGVIFTVHPLDPTRDTAYLEANYGTGESVVGGLVTPDCATISRSGGGAVEMVTANKRRMTAVFRDALGSQVIGLEESRRDTSVLTDEEARAVFRMGRRIEDLNGATTRRRMGLRRLAAVVDTPGPAHHRDQYAVTAESVLVAGLVARGSRQQVELISTPARSEPGFWSEYVRRATEVEGRLIERARFLAALSRGPDLNGDLRHGYLALRQAMEEMASFVVATPSASAALRADAADLLAGEAGDDVLDRLFTSGYEPDAVGDMRNGYRIALEILAHDDAAELFRTTSPRIALARVHDDYPQLHAMIRDHVDTYGWLRTRGYRHDPLSAESLVYRIQLVLIRWPADAVRQAAEGQPAPRAEEILGFSPSEPLAALIGAAQALATHRRFRVEGLLRAECVARPFLARIAETLECSSTQLFFASAAEVEAALATGPPLPLAEIDARAANGFTVAPHGDTAVVRSLDAPPAGAHGSRPAAEGVTGMTACRGTAVGRVRIVFDQEELLGLAFGDVIVTAASTIDPTDTTGETTVFPTRNGGPYARALQRAAAVVADEGGLLSHAAIVCRERASPACWAPMWAPRPWSRVRWSRSMPPSRSGS